MIILPRSKEQDIDLQICITIVGAEDQTVSSKSHGAGFVTDVERGEERRLVFGWEKNFRFEIDEGTEDSWARERFLPDKITNFEG